MDETLGLHNPEVVVTHRDAGRWLEPSQITVTRCTSVGEQCSYGIEVPASPNSRCLLLVGAIPPGCGRSPLVESASLDNSVTTMFLGWDVFADTETRSSGHNSDRDNLRTTVSRYIVTESFERRNVYATQRSTRRL